MKFLFLIPDGVADRPGKEKTPLSEAQKNAIGELEKDSLVGFAKTIPYGFDPGSDIGTMNLFGFPPNLYFTGRAPLEVSAKGVELSEEDVVFRMNFVWIEDRIMKDHSAGHPKDDHAQKLLEICKKEFLPILKKEGFEVEFYHGKSYRNYAVFRKRPELAKVKTTPPHDIVEKKIDEFLPNHPILKKLIEISIKVLPEKTAVWFWGQGTRPNLPNFEKIWRKKACVVSAVDLVKGIGKLCGMKVLEVEGVTGWIDTNFEGKVKAVLEELEKGADLGIIHIEATDEAGHQGNFELKKKAIELFDREVVARVIDECSKRFRKFKVLISPDHPTPIDIRTHSPEPVPFLLWRWNGKLKGKLKFCEESFKDTPLMVQGNFLLKLLFSEV